MFGCHCFKEKLGSVPSDAIAGMARSYRYLAGSGAQAAIDSMGNG